MSDFLITTEGLLVSKPNISSDRYPVPGWLFSYLLDIRADGIPVLPPGFSPFQAIWLVCLGPHNWSLHNLSSHCLHHPQTSFKVYFRQVQMEYYTKMCMKLPYVRRSVGWLIGRNSLKGREVSLSMLLSEYLLIWDMWHL